MNENMSDEEFKRIYGRPPVRKTVKRKIYWNRIIVCGIIFIALFYGIIRLVGCVFSGNDDASSLIVKSTATDIESKDSSESTSSSKAITEAAKSVENPEYSNVNMTVCLDAGHGDYDSGTADNSLTRFEKDDNLAVTLVVQKYLEAYGVNVVMTRDDDSFLELSERCDVANNAKADFFVCLHRNSYDGDISGVEVWVHNSEPSTDTALATDILNNLDDVGISENRGVQFGYVGNSNVNYYVNTHTVMPSCLVELGFLTSDEDNELFDEKLEEYGKAIANGIVQSGIELGVVDKDGTRLIDGELTSEKETLSDSSSEGDVVETEPSTTNTNTVYNTQENETDQ